MLKSFGMPALAHRYVLQAMCTKSRHCPDWQPLKRARKAAACLCRYWL